MTSDERSRERRARGTRRSAKTRATYYTPERVATARDNVERHEWAAERRRRAVETADAYLDRLGGIDGLWRWVTGQRIPRTIRVSRAGSPITGERLHAEHGHYPWIGDDRLYDEGYDGQSLGPWNGRGSHPLSTADAPDIDPPDEPWKLVDPTSGYVFPTNDFAAYRESGLDDRGFFDPDLADDAFLENESYPEKGEDWGVDDGTGWVADDGTVYAFAAYYNHFFVWIAIHYVVQALRDAHLLDCDPRYARAGSVLLDRVADVYPELDIGGYDPDGPFHNSHGMAGQGKAVGGMAWGNRMAQAYCSAYDAVFPDQDADDGLVSFLSKKSGEYPGLAEKSSLDDVRGHFEENVVREVLPAVKRGQLRGSFGTHQVTLAWAGVVLDEVDGYTRDALEFVLQPGQFHRKDDGSIWGQTYVTGGDVLPRIVDEVDRDGHYEKGSPTYNRGPLHLREVANLLDVYGDLDGTDLDCEGGVDLYGNPKFERVFHGRTRLPMLNSYLPHVGDTMLGGDPGIPLNREAVRRAFEQYGDPTYARTLHLFNGRTAEGLHGDVFDEDADALSDRVREILEAAGPLDLPSENLAGYGLATLRDGSVRPDGTPDRSRRATWLYYGRNGVNSHNHADALNLGVFAYGLNLAPDLGYPEEAVHDYPKHDWTKGTVSHNTVVVDDESQDPMWVGRPRHFAGDDGRVQLIDVEAPGAYPDVDRYRRSVATIRIDEERSYLVDVFAVAGGDDHLYSFHGAEGVVETEGLELEPQNGGTYAGPDVPLPSRGERDEYNRDVGDGYNYLDGVRRDGDPPARFSVDWDVEDTWDVLEGDGVAGIDPSADVHLRLTMLGDCDEVALAEGEPPLQPDNPDRLTYLLARRTGNDLESLFASVIEPYEGSRIVDSISAAPVTGEDGEQAPDARAVRVDLASGRTDYVATAFDRERTYEVGGTFRFRGFFATYSTVDGEPAFAHLEDGSLLETVEDATGPAIRGARARYAGRVETVTDDLSGENGLTATLSDPTGVEETVGDWLYAETDGERNGAYEIRGVDADGDRVVFDLGEQPTVRRFADPADPEAGFVTNVEPSAAVVIPRRTVWRRGE